MSRGSIQSLPSQTKGVDYSFARPPMGDLAAYGGFVSRYVSIDNPKTHGKILFPAEVEQLAAADLGVMLNFELAADSAFAGYQAGRAHADSAGEQAENLGVPHGLPIVFSVDTNIDRTRWPALDAYFHGCNDSLAGAYAVGDYVESDYIDHLDAEGLSTLHWWPAASSWSGGRITPLAHVQQLVGTPVAGCDGNVLLRETPFWFPGREPLKPTEADMDFFVYQCADADAAFLGLSTPAGIVPWVEWLSGGRKAQYKADGLIEKPVTVANFANCTLIGALPQGDSRHTWVASDFAQITPAGPTGPKGDPGSIPHGTFPATVTIG